jgi:hypothetical protein
VVALAACGCENQAELTRQLHQRGDALEADLKRCTEALGDRDGQIAVLERRIENQGTLAGVELSDLFVVDRIVLVSRTGGTDFDGQPGDDGVTVYVQPVDAVGDVIKAAGQFTIQLADLTTPGQPRELGTYIFDKRDVLETAWYGGMLTNHYTFKCEFPPQVARSPSREVYVRVTFLDWLTGKEFTDSVTVNITLVDPDNALAPTRAR